MATKSFALRLTHRVVLVIWWLTLLLHLACTACYAVTAYGYYFLPSTLVIWAVIAFHIGIDPQYFPVLTGLFGTMALVHMVMALHMIIASVRAGEWSLGDRSQAATREPFRRKNQRDRGLQRISRLLLRVYNATLGSTGPLGIEHPNFEQVLLARGLLQLVLQTIQAYRMGNTLANRWLNWIVVSLLVIKCMSMPIILHRIDHPGLARFLAIVFSMALDFILFTVLPCMLIMPYYNAYNPITRDFATVHYFTGSWMIDMFNHFSMMVVQSGWDAAQKLLVAANLATCMLTCRYMLQDQEPLQRPSVIQPVAPWTHGPNSLIMVSQPRSAMTSPRHLILVRRTPQERWWACCMSTSRAMKQHANRVVYGLYVCTGIVIFLMAVRTAAIQRKDPHGCAVKAYPWLGDKPACTLLEIDCDNANTTGVSNDIATLIAEVDPYRVLYLSFRHCPALEVPQTIQTLENLKVLRFDNSTIAQWTQEAAITNTHHKHLVMVLLTRVNLTNIPEGFLDPDFPQGLQDIEFCVTNLSSVPDQLDKRWPRDMWFTMDHARFDAIPDTFVRMQPGYLSMFGNQITKIQASALLNHAMVELSGNPIEALPDLDPNDWSHASDIRFADTSVRARPNWMTVDFMQTHVVVAGNTPLCSDPTALPAGVDREDICVPAAMFDCDSFYDQEWELM